MDSAQDLVGVLDDVIAFEEFGAKSSSGDFDFLGQTDLFLASEQWDFSHLSQIHPDRIIRPGLDIVHSREQIVFALELDLVLGDHNIDHRIGQIIAFFFKR